MPIISRRICRPSDVGILHIMPVYNYSIYVTKAIIKHNDQILRRRSAAMPSKFVNFIFSFPI